MMFVCINNVYMYALILTYTLTFYTHTVKDIKSRTFLWVENLKNVMLEHIAWGNYNNFLNSL